VRRNHSKSETATCNSSCKPRLRNQHAIEVEGKLRQEAADCVAQIAILPQAQGEGQERSVEARNLQQQLQNQPAA
jgi:hypothetical protein